MNRPAERDEVRLDKWLWAARFFKTRSMAAEAIDGGRIRVNGERAKRARPVQVGDEVEVRLPPYSYGVVIRGLSGHRGPARAAALLYEETRASADLRERVRLQVQAAGGLWSSSAGERPTKRDRRRLDRLRGREEGD